MYRIRVAKLSDREPIERLIQASVRVLAVSDYSLDQIEGDLVHAWGVDTQLEGISKPPFFCSSVCPRPRIAGLRVWDRLAYLVLKCPLIKDETYFVVENDEIIVACGG